MRSCTYIYKQTCLGIDLCTVVAMNYHSNIQLCMYPHEYTSTTSSFWDCFINHCNYRPNCVQRHSVPMTSCEWECLMYCKTPRRQFFYLLTLEWLSIGSYQLPLVTSGLYCDKYISLYDNNRKWFYYLPRQLVSHSCAISSDNWSLTRVENCPWVGQFSVLYNLCYVWAAPYVCECTQRSDVWVGQFSVLYNLCYVWAAPYVGECTQRSDNNGWSQ